MATSEEQKKAINLGRLLVQQLDRHSANDTVTRWMCFYVAELMTQAEAASSAEKDAANERCFQAILQLWGHRHDFPDGRRPLEGFEPILKYIERLNPNEENSYGYPFHLFSHATAVRGREQDVYKHLQFVDDVDRVARLLIAFGLRGAAEKAVDAQTKKLLEAALGTPRADVQGIVQLLKLGDAPAGDSEVTHLTRHLEYLDRFLKTGGSLRSTLAKELAEEQAKIPSAALPAILPADSSAESSQTK